MKTIAPSKKRCRKRKRDGSVDVQPGASEVEVGRKKISLAAASSFRECVPVCRVRPVVARRSTHHIVFIPFEQRLLLFLLPNLESSWQHNEESTRPKSPTLTKMRYDPKASNPTSHLPFQRKRFFCLKNPKHIDFISNVCLLVPFYTNSSASRSQWSRSPWVVIS